MPETKMITHDTYLKALALFTLANDHAVQSTEYADGLCSLLGYTERYAGHVSDEIYSGQRRASAARFLEALEKEGFTIIVPNTELPPKKGAIEHLVEQGVISAEHARLLTGSAPKRKKRRGKK